METANKYFMYFYKKKLGDVKKMGGGVGGGGTKSLTRFIIKIINIILRIFDNTIAINTQDNIWSVNDQRMKA